MRRKAATNVVATMLIFAIMITSIGVLYSQIAPTLLGYETTTTSTSQSYIFQSVANEVQRLSSSTVGSVGRVHIVATQTTYDINPQKSLQVDVRSDGISQAGVSENIGEYIAYINGSFQPRGEDFLNRVSSEDFYVVNNTGDSMWVLKADYSYREGQITMYFRSHVSIFSTGVGNWKITIMIYKIDFLASTLDSSPLIFPVEFDEWTLRLRRQSSIVSSTNFLAGNSVTVTHDVDGVSGTIYNFPGIQVNDNVDVDIITIPILFGI